MFERLKRLFKKEHGRTAETTELQAQPSSQPSPTHHIERICKNCGKPFSINPESEHTPNYCRECKAKYRAEQRKKSKDGRGKRTCRSCGCVFTVSTAVKHLPNYCRTCKAEYRRKNNAG